jgi:hypothetical protein
MEHLLIKVQCFPAGSVSRGPSSWNCSHAGFVVIHYHTSGFTLSKEWTVSSIYPSPGFGDGGVGVIGGCGLGVGAVGVLKFFMEKSFVRDILYQQV